MEEGTARGDERGSGFRPDSGQPDRLPGFGDGANTGLDSDDRRDREASPTDHDPV